MQIHPLGDKILIRPLKEATQTSSGIVIPETVDKEKPQQGEVLAVGSGKLSDNGNLIPMHIDVGDKVLFTKYAPTEIKHEGEDLYILSQDDVLAIIK